ncbi:MAG: hypothetical protein AAB590_03960 [Patescibacteria group bacterium]
MKIPVSELVNSAICHIEWLKALGMFNLSGQWKNRRGGYLVIAYDRDGMPDAIVKVATISLPRIGKDKALKYWKYALAKDRVLRNNPLATSTADIGFMPGGIRVRSENGVMRISFSGLPPEGDDAFVILVCLVQKLMTRQLAMAHFEKLKNEHGLMLLKMKG